MSDAHTESPLPSVPSTPSKTKKNKKGQKNVEPEFDLSKVLPSSADLRTSLLMPNLSARFSMLREQDDPNSILGKANDDSVLYPKRISKLGIFANGMGGLADIAEVESLRGSIRPPFAAEGRSNSFDGGYGTDDDSTYAGSMMSRSKPGQGNNLFGGRQKLYQIPMGSSPSKNITGALVAESGMGGRLVYEDDVTLSAFQRWKQREREGAQVSEEEVELTHEGVPANEESASVSSPSTAFSRDRRTTSSTNSAPSNKRTSTAATSIDSQHTSTSQLTKTNSQSQSQFDRQATVHRRLYGQALDQPTSSRDLVESFNRKRAASNDKTSNPLLHSKSATNIHERFQRTTPVYSSSSFFRAASPSPSASSPQQTSIDLITSETDGANKPFGYVPPLSPPISDSDSATTLSHSVQPEDRGKATAMGLFNKPSRQYDETQFSQRQMQMHVDNNRMIQNRSSPPTGALPSVPTTSTASRASSDASSIESHSRSTIYSKRTETPEAIPEMRETNAGSGSPPEIQNSAGTFLDTMSQDDESDVEQPVALPSVATPRQDESHIHPALRSARVSDASNYDDLDMGIVQLEPPPVQDHAEETEYNRKSGSSVDHGVDSPTLGPVASVGGLGGLVRAHLRQDSERSNQPASPLFPPGSSELAKGVIAPSFDRSHNQSDNMQNNPWEAAYEKAMEAGSKDDIDHVQGSRVQPSPMTISEKARQILGQATALREQKQSKAERVLGENVPRFDEETAPQRTWQEEMQLHHQRNGSTETQKDREEFENELAERRRRVQENVRSIAELNSSANSHKTPAASEEQPSRVESALSKLRPRPSKRDISDSGSKAMKMLGLGSATMNHTSRSKSPTFQSRRDEDEQVAQNTARRLVPRSPRSPLPAQDHYSPNPVPADMQQAESGDYNHDLVESGVRQGSSPDSLDEKTYISQARSAPSRNGRYRDDLEQAMDEGRSSMARDHYNANPPSSIKIPSRPSQEAMGYSDRSASAAGYRSNQRTSPYPTGSDYFENKPSQGVHGRDAIDVGLSPRPSHSPNTPYSANSTPPLAMDRSPGLQAPERQPPTSYSTSHLPMQRPRKQSVNRGMISDPTLISSSNGSSPYGVSHPGPRNFPDHVYNLGSDQRDPSPPVPAMNPRRPRPTLNQYDGLAPPGRQTPVDRQMPRSADHLNIMVPPHNAAPLSPPSANSAYGALEDQAHFVDRSRKVYLRPRPNLRKSTSEGGNMNARARAERMKSERSPGLPPMRSPTPVQSPYQQQYSGPRPYSPAMGPPPSGRSRTPTISQGMSHGMPVGQPPHTGRPMGWQENSPPRTMVSGPDQGRSSPAPGQMPRMRRPSEAAQMGGPPVRQIHGMDPSDGRSTPLGQRMRAPSRAQREMTVDGPMF